MPLLWRAFDKPPKADTVTQHGLTCPLSYTDNGLFVSNAGSIVAGI